MENDCSGSIILMLPFNLINSTLGPKELAFKRRQSKARLLSKNGAHHWPFESLEYLYAVACVETVLRYSEAANSIYDEIVGAWKFPGCQALLKGFNDCSEVTNNWIVKAFKALENGKPLRDWPHEWPETYFKFAPTYFEGEPHNDDWEYLLDSMDEFIFVGFNRQIDLDNETYKVIPDNSPLLKSAIIFLSRAENAKVKPEDFRYRQTRIDGILYDIDAIMAEKPTADPGRNIYRTLINTYQQYGFKLKHNDKLLEYAELWYKSRVSPGTIEACRDEFANQGIYLERSNVETVIADCDRATGYPRKWRK